MTTTVLEQELVLEQLTDDLTRIKLKTRLKQTKKDWLHYSFLEEFLLKRFTYERDRGNEVAASEIANVYDNILKKAQIFEKRFGRLYDKLKSYST